jgi:intermembrane space import and assembly protein 40
MEQAIDPITGKINWDCPCMGNNPKGPCGKMFKKAFECFVKNQQEPDKCTPLIDIMQKCQEKYPNVYKEG